VSLRDFVLGSRPSGGDLDQTRREAIPTAGAAGYSPAIERLLTREGGYVNDPVDRGGETNFGISKRSYPDLDIAKLTKDQAADIYKRDYWDAIGADRLPEGTREIAFDAAVNHGVGRTQQLLQEAGGDPEALLAARKRLYDSIVAKDPSQQKFYDGWMNRLEGLKSTGSYEERGSGGPSWQSSMPLPASGKPARSAAWNKILGASLPNTTPEAGVEGADYAKALAITGGDFAKAPVAALENLTGQLSGEGQTGVERSLAGTQERLGGVRRSIGEWQKGFFEQMTPESLDRAQREMLTLDPNKTIWQGGVGEFMSSMALKGTLSLGPTIGPMVTTAILARLGAGASASTLFGAQEGLVSAGLTAAQIAEEIEQTSPDELRKIPRYNELLAQVGEAEAKRQYVNEVQGVIPAVTGILVGAIAKAVGKPLDRIFGTGAGLPLGGRVLAGAGVEAAQEAPQSFIEQVMQNYAKLAYDSNINLLDGAAEQAVQGMLLGGVMGGTFAGMFGNRPQRTMSSDPVPQAIRDAINGPAEAIPTGAAPPPPLGGPTAPGAPPPPPGAPPSGGEELSLAPDAPPVVDRFAQQTGQTAGAEAIPFNAVVPDRTVAFNDTVDLPPDSPLQPKPKAARGGKQTAIPLALDIRPGDQPLPDAGIKPDLSPVDQSLLGTMGELPWDPNAQAPVTPIDMTPAPEQPTPSFDVNQQREPKWGQRSRTEMLGYRVRTRGPNGELIASKLVDNKATAKIFAKQAEARLRPGETIEMVPARRTFRNDKTPTAEPVSDLLAQIRDMQSKDALDRRMDPDSRQAVYLTRESLDNLREAGQLEQALRGGVPINNFDTYGGVLLARDEATAQELMQFIEDPESNLDEVIGYATGAGDGKPGGNNPVVQLLDAEGNVIRERQVTPEEVESTKKAWGPMARSMPLERALALRQNRMQREKAERTVAREQEAFTATKPDEQVGEIFRENPLTEPLADEAVAAAKQGGFEEDVGGRLVDLAQETRAQELKRRAIDKRVPAPEDVTFRGREIVERSREATRLRRAGKADEAASIAKSLAGQSSTRGELSTAYEKLYGELRDAALRVELARKGGNVAELNEAEIEYDRIIDELQSFFDVEGGYTKAQAAAMAASRYSPKARKEAMRAAAADREEKQAAKDKAQEEALGAVRAGRKERSAKMDAGARSRDERIISRGDTAREEKKLERIEQAEKVSVETMAQQLKRNRVRISTPEGQRLVDNLFMYLSPSVGRDLDQLMAQTGKKNDEKTRAALGTALIEIHQYLQQWLSDYRLAIKLNTPADVEEGVLRRNQRIFVRAAELTEMLGSLRAYHQGDIGIADDAARLLAHRISGLVIHGKRNGVATEMDIDGFWNAAAKGPMAFRDYLQDTVQSREDQSFPTDLTAENLEQASLGKLNALYVKAVQQLDGSRENDGQRKAIIEAIKKAARGRGLKLSDKPQLVKIRLWDPRKHEMVEVERTISPLKLFAETFRRSYGLKGADRRMSMDQLRDLYLKGGEITVWENGAVALEGETYTYAPTDRTSGVRATPNMPLKGASWGDWIEGDFTADDAGPDVLLFDSTRQSRKPFTKPKGKSKTIKLEPLGKALPEALPLSTLARRLPASAKKKIILRASRAAAKKRHGESASGGRSQSTGLIRTAGSNRTRYSTNVLIQDVAPRELGKRATEYAERLEGATQLLADALSNAEKFLALARSRKFKAAAGDRQAYLHAKAYTNWLYQYGTALANANLKSWAAINEMARVAVDLNEIATLNPEQFVDKIEERFNAELGEQIYRTVALDPVNLKGLRNPETRAEMLAESFKRLRKRVMFHRRLTEAWGKHPVFVETIQPVLNKISESIVVRHRGMNDLRGKPLAEGQIDELPVFTAEERKKVGEILEEWRTAKDKSYAERGRLFKKWGVPARKGETLPGSEDVWAANLYDDFYLPLNEMLVNAGFFDPDVALLKQYRRNYSPLEDQSTGSVSVTLTGESWDGKETNSLRYVSTVEADPMAEAARELDRRNQEAVDQQLVALDDGDLIDATIVDRGETRPLTVEDRERRKKLISSPLGKAAKSSRMLLRANEVIANFVNVLEDRKSTIGRIALAESRMIEELRAVGVWKDVGETTGEIGLPSGKEILAELEKEQDALQRQETKLDKLREDPAADTFSKKSLLDTRPAKQIAWRVARIQELQEEMAAIRALNLGDKSKTIGYTKVAGRLRAKELTLEAARLSAGARLSGLFVPKARAKVLGGTVSDQLKERAKAKAVEEKRRAKMSPEQVKLAEAYDRRGVPMALPAVAGGGRLATRNEASAAIELRELLKDSWARRRNPDGTKGYHVLRSLSDMLGEDHFYSPLVRALQQMPAVMQMNVTMVDGLGSSGMFFPERSNDDNTGTLGQEVAIDRTSVDDLGHNELIHTALHEFVHAASMQTLTMGNPDVTASWEELRRITQQALSGHPQYGKFDGSFGNLYEFVAEVFTNPELQQAMKGVKVHGIVGRLWQRLVAVLRRVFSMPPEYSNLLDVAASLQTQTLGGDPYTARGHQKYLQGYKGGATTSAEEYYEDVKIRGVPFPKAVQPLVNSAFMQQEKVQTAMRRAAAMKDSAQEGGQSFLLKALSMRQIEQFFSERFGGKDGPLGRYIKAFEGRNSYASALLEEADKLSRRWTAIEEGRDGEGVELSRIMHDATVQGVHADEAGSALNARFRTLSPAAQQLYKDVRDYYKVTQKREVQLMLANALRASKLWKGGEIVAEDIDLDAVSKGDWLQQKLGIDLKAERAKLAADAKKLDPKAFKAREADIENTAEEMKLIARMANIPMMNEGPYFPLMRFGDYAVKAERTVATETYATRTERSEAMERWLDKDPTLQFSFPKTEAEDSFPLTIREVEFRLAETHFEANESRKELLEAYAGGEVSEVQLKRNLISNEATIGSNRALQTLLGKLDGNAAAQAAMREFYIKSLSDRSFRKREAKRKNYRGADPKLQHRTFGAYSKSASYYTSQLKYGHVMADAKADMEKVAEKQGVRAGQVVQEIKIRDDQAASLTDTHPFVRKAVETGQLWLLLSPSYWMVNATQPWMVTVPWLAGRSDLPTAVKALTEAQAMIIDPLVTQGVKSWGGIKALKSRLAAEQAFSVLENVEGTIRQKLGKDAQPVLDMLTALKRESIIDMSFVAELRNVAEGDNKTAWDKVMDASRVMAHLTEVNNRIMTAVAAYNVAKATHQTLRQKGTTAMTPEEVEAFATDFAKRAVAETQFDYSAANKPRLFSANDAWWKPLVFQFMQYVQHMYVLFFRHFGMWAKDPFGRAGDAKIGRRVVLGLLATHMAAGGLLGVSPQIAKWAAGLVMLALGGGDDEDRNFAKLLSGDLYDNVMSDAVAWLLGDGKAGEVARAGLPRLAGFDLSNRLAFLQTYMIDIDGKSAETLYGSLVTSFGGPMFGIAGNAFMAAQLALEGDADKAWEKLLPKLGRDAVRASRFWREGMVDSSGKTILDADEMSPWELFVTAMGFQPSQISEVYARNTRSREAEAYVAKRKAEIGRAYRKSRSTGEINQVMADLREHNAKFPHPKDRITLSQLIRGAREMRRSELNIQRYGVDAGRRSAEYDSDTYNVE